MTQELTYQNTSRSVQLSHGKLHFHEAGNGPALILLHGSGPGVYGWANFAGNLPLFAQHFHCYIPDLPGYGESDAAAGDPLQATVKSVLEFMDSQNIKQADVIGNSLGGIIASHIAAKHGERVSKLCMIGGVGYNLFTAFPNEGITRLVEFTEEPTRERLVLWLRSMVFDPAVITDDIIEERWRRATDPKTLAVSRMIYTHAAMKAIKAGQFNALAHLPDIKCPVLLTWGRDDRVSSIDRALMPMRLIPKCELHTFYDCGHWAMIERKAEFESVVLAFFKRAA